MTNEQTLSEAVRLIRVLVAYSHEPLPADLLAQAAAFLERFPYEPRADAAVNICQGCKQPTSLCACASLVNRQAEPPHIPTWRERCETHPEHQGSIVTSVKIERRMQEEIDDLRNALNRTCSE